MLAGRFEEPLWHEVVNFALGMVRDDRLECFGDVGDRVDVVELTGRHDGCEQGPVFGSDLMTSEEGVFWSSRSAESRFHRISKREADTLASELE